MEQTGGEDFAKGHYPADEFGLIESQDRLETAGEEFYREKMVAGMIVASGGSVAQHKDIVVG